MSNFVNVMITLPFLCFQQKFIEHLQVAMYVAVSYTHLTLPTKLEV